MDTLRAIWLGRMAYAPAFALQQRLAEQRAGGLIGDTLLLLEHDPVYTLGRRATDAEVLLDPAELAARGISVERTDRGGRVTYHGPGQLVGYPILNLGANGDLVGYVRALERALISTVASYGIDADTIEGLTGVWVGDAKIAAIGVHVSRGVTTHGFALNVSADLDAFNGIIPCGIVDRGVTSIAEQTGISPSVVEVSSVAAAELARELGTSLETASPEALGVEVNDVRA
jgi:lipoyl(octanoyl) transferase